MCKICNTTVSSRSYLREHEKIVHLKRKDFKCDECGSYFAYRHVLKTHIKDVVHLKIKNHHCEHCGAAFSQKGNLNIHMNAAHRGENPKKSAMKKLTKDTK